jgi:hypothetical protein
MSAALPRSFRAVILLAPLIGLLTGCPPKQPGLPQAQSADGVPPPNGQSASPIGPSAAQPASWPFWPKSMRLHPLTRLALDPETGEQVIECRIEFLDPDGQTSRAVGQLTLQLYPDAGTPTADNLALQTWNQDLRDLALNRRQYDVVTRTYLFRLQITQPLPVGADLRAFFLSLDGQRMLAEMRVR